MSSIKQLIVNAIIKVSTENPSFNHEGEPTAEEARDNFIKLLLAELFPEDPAVPVIVPTVAAAASPESSPSRKKRAPMSDEAKALASAKRKATLAAKKNASVSPASENPVPPTSGSNAAAGGAAAPAEPVKEKKPPKPKGEKPAKDANVPKMGKEWKDALKKADKDHAKDLEPELLKYLNAFSKDDFDAKKAEEHVADFLASRSDGKVDAELVVVDFNGKEYYVNPETKRVYEGEGTCDEDGNWTNYKGVGYVGMAAFAEMTIEE